MSCFEELRANLIHRGGDHTAEGTANNAERSCGLNAFAFAGLF